MMNLTLYVERDSIIHKIDPITKLIYCVVAASVPYIISEHMFTFFLMLISIALLFIGKVFRKMIPLYLLSMFIFITIVIIQGIFHPDNVTPLISFGPATFFKEGLMLALLLILRIINMISAFGVLILTTQVDDLIQSLVKKGMSPRVGYMIGSVLQIIPHMSSMVSTISDAQRSRGLETEGKLSTRIKAFFPLIGPVIMNSLIATKERAIALELRGFNSRRKKTFLQDDKEFLFGKPCQLILILFFIGMIIWRILQ